MSKNILEEIIKKKIEKIDKLKKSISLNSLTDIINKTADQVYIWLLDKSDGKLKLLGAVRSGDRYVIRLEEPIMKNHVRNLIVTDRIYVEFEKATNYGIHLEDLMDVVKKYLNQRYDNFIDTFHEENFI